MSDINLSLTKRQYERLLELAYMGHWMASSCETNTDELDQEYDELESSLFALAPEVGLDGFISSEDEDSPIMPSVDFEERELIRKQIETYDEHTFWDELTSRITGRLLGEKYSQDEFESMEQEEQFLTFMEIEKKVSAVLTEEGLDALLPSIKELAQK